MTDIFEDGTTPQTTEAAVVAPATPQVPETLKEWVGEGKKYATVEAAMAALGPAQTHISKLEQELAELRAAQAQAASVDDVRKAVEDLLAERGNLPAKPDEAHVVSIVDSLLQSRERQQKQDANVAAFKAELGKAYGDKAKEQFGAVAAQHGLTPAQLSEMVKTSPTAALRLFDLGTSGKHVLASDVNLDSFGKPTVNIPPKKDIMRGSSNKDLLDAWRRVGVLVQQDNKE